MELAGLACADVSRVRLLPAAGASFTGASKRLFAARSSARVSISRCASSRLVVAAQAASPLPDVPTVSSTKTRFLNAYRRPIPSLYNGVVQELLVQQHLIRFNANYKYDPIFATGFITVYDQLMDGYPYGDDKEAIFKAYIEAIKEDPAQYRSDAAAVEEWAGKLSGPEALSAFSERDSPIDLALQDIKARASGDEPGGSFLYSRLFAIGLFRILEITRSADPAVLAKLCSELGLNKGSVDRDLDVYRGLLNKLTQGKDLMRDYLDREKARKEERAKLKEQASK